MFLANINDAVELSYITSMLNENKIPFRLVSEDAGQYLSIIHVRSFFGRSIYVRSCDYPQAIEIVQSYRAQITPQDEQKESPVPFKRKVGLIGIYILAYVIIGLLLLGYV